MNKCMITAAAALLFVMPASLGAADLRGGERQSIPASEIIEDDLYVGGGTVRVSGTVNGDLYSGGGTVLIQGPIQNDLVVGGGTVTVSGAVGDDLRIGGGTVIVQGSVADDLLVGGGDVTIIGDGIGGDAVVAAGTLELEAPVSGTVRLYGGEIYLNGPVGGDVFARVEKLTLGPNAQISGSLTYTSPEEALIADSAVVVGGIAYEPSDVRDDMEKAAMAFLTLSAIASLFMLLFGAFVIGLLFRRFSTEAVERAYTHPLLEMMIGTIALIVLPVVSVFLMLTVVGLPLGVLGLLSWLMLLIFSWLFAPVLLGALLYGAIKKSEGRAVHWKSVVLGVLAYFVVGIIPFLGAFIQFVLILLTLGTVLSFKWRVAKEWR